MSFEMWDSYGGVQGWFRFLDTLPKGAAVARCILYIKKTRKFPSIVLLSCAGLVIIMTK